jgi:hypothetical protein
MHMRCVLAVFPRNDSFPTNPVAKFDSHEPGRKFGSLRIEVSKVCGCQRIMAGDLIGHCIVLYSSECSPYVQQILPLLVLSYRKL